MDYEINDKAELHKVKINDEKITLSDLNLQKGIILRADLLDNQRSRFIHAIKDALPHFGIVVRHLNKA